MNVATDRLLYLYSFFSFFSLPPPLETQETKSQSTQTDDHRLGFVDTRTGVYHWVKIRRNYEEMLNVLSLTAIEERVVLGDNY